MTAGRRAPLLGAIGAIAGLTGALLWASAAAAPAPPAASGPVPSVVAARATPAASPVPTGAVFAAATAPPLASSSAAAPSPSSLPTLRPAVRSPSSPAASSPVGVPAPAPSSAVGFKPRDTVVPIGFPLHARSGYRYGDLWRVPRLGVVYPYNQIRAVTSTGALLRAHDGVDLPVRNGTAVLAPFAGVVVNPAAIWKPWDPERYGRVVVIRSTESTSRGYYVILAHLSTRSVLVGDRVRRGEGVGRTGQTGNAEGTAPHLHLELRAPFKIAYAYAGVRRMVDVFDPLPSLHEADPNR